VLILAGFVIMVAGMKAAGVILVFSGGDHRRHLRLAYVLAATQGRAEALWGINRSFAE